MDIHTIKSDLRRYGFANVNGYRVTGKTSTGFSLWKVGKLIDTFTTLEQLLTSVAVLG